MTKNDKIIVCRIEDGEGHSLEIVNGKSPDVNKVISSETGLGYVVSYFLP